MADSRSGLSVGTKQIFDHLGWSGLQVIFDRENVVDLTIHFNCLAGPWLIEEQFINLSVGPMSSQLQLVSKMIEQTNGNLNAQMSDKAQALLKAKQYPRGKTVFGKVSKFIAEMSDDNFLNTWISSGNQQYMSELYQSGDQPDAEFGLCAAFSSGLQSRES